MRVRTKLLTHFFSRPEERFYARELARSLGERYNAVWEELGNLEQAGLVSRQEAEQALESAKDFGGDVPAGYLPAALGSR